MGIANDLIGDANTYGELKEADVRKMHAMLANLWDFMPEKLREDKSVWKTQRIFDGEGDTASLQARYEKAMRYLRKHKKHEVIPVLIKKLKWVKQTYGPFSEARLRLQGK